MYVMKKSQEFPFLMDNRNLIAVPQLSARLCLKFSTASAKKNLTKDRYYSLKMIY